MWAVVAESPVTGLPVKVSFDGQLIADPDIQTLLEQYATRWGHVGVTPVGPYLPADLTSESGAYLVAVTALMRAKLVAGEIPALPDVPPVPENAAQ